MVKAVWVASFALHKSKMKCSCTGSCVVDTEWKGQLGTDVREDDKY